MCLRQAFLLKVPSARLSLTTHAILPVSYQDFEAYEEYGEETEGGDESNEDQSAELEEEES